MIVELCVHRRYEPHQVTQGWVTDAGGHSAVDYECPGGRVLEQAIIIERDKDGNVHDAFAGVSLLREAGYIVIEPDPLSAWWPWPEWAIEATVHVMGWQRGEVPTARGVLNALASAQENHA